MLQFVLAKRGEVSAMAQIHKRKLLSKIQGAFIILIPFVLVALMGIATLVVDAGVLRIARAELQNAVDAAALAAATQLPNGTSAAQSAVTNLINLNTILDNQIAGNIQTQFGTWDSNSQVFTTTNNSPTAVKVIANITPPLFFARLFTSNNYTLSAQSIASLIGGPRDIIFIADLSPAMNEYSRLQSVLLIGTSTVINNLYQIYLALNLPPIGNMQWTPQLLLGSSSVIKTTLGLTNTNYPYPSGSWTSYINYVKSDPFVAAALYQDKYGYLTFVDYLLTQEPGFSQTPDFWKTPQQPLQAMKDTVNNFATNSVSSADRLGLVTFNGGNGSNAVLEQSLTNNFSIIPSILNGNISTNTPGRQAAHYSMGLIMTSAIQMAVDELANNGRSDAQKIIYILTTAQISNSGIAALLNNVQDAANQNITINTISIGSQGNSSLMQQIAQMTGGQNAQVTASSTNYTDTLGQMSHITGKAALVK